jgi:hypothetical protein
MGGNLRRMAKRKAKNDASENQETPKKVYPSRANAKYVSIPKHYHAALAEYARQHSTPDDKKSVSWACRVAVRLLAEQAAIKLRAVRTSAGDDDEEEENEDEDPAS